MWNLAYNTLIMDSENTFAYRRLKTLVFSKFSWQWHPFHKQDLSAFSKIAYCVTAFENCWFITLSSNFLFMLSGLSESPNLPGWPMHFFNCLSFSSLFFDYTIHRLSSSSSLTLLPAEICFSPPFILFAFYSLFRDQVMLLCQTSWFVFSLHMPDLDLFWS